MRLSDYDEQTVRAAKRLFARQQRSIYKHTDRLFAVLMGIQWPACILAALVLSPKSWVGASSSVSNNLWAAIFLGGGLTVFPILLAIFRPGKASTRYTIAVTQMLMSALLVHVSGGRVETHFHIFGSLAFLSFYRDWRVLVPATAVVALDHILRGFFWPQSIYGIVAPDDWRWLEHAGWVLFEDIFLIISIRRSVMEMRNIAKRTSQIRHLNDGLEQRVSSRTAELANSNESLELEVANRRRLHTESETIAEIMHSITPANTLDETLALINISIKRILNAENFSVAFYDSGTDALRMSYYHDSREPVPYPSEMKTGLATLVMRKRQPIQLDRDAIIRLVEHGDASFEGEVPANWLGVPIKSLRDVVGVLVVRDYEDIEAYGDGDAKFLESVCYQISLAIERKQAEEIRQRSEESFRDLFENAPVAYHELDRAGRYVRINHTEEELFGYTSEELQGHHVSEFVVEKEASLLTASYLAEHDGRMTAERTFIRKDGTRVSVLKEDRLIKTADGQIVGIRSTLQDLTERRELEEKLMRGQKLESIGQLAAGIAHEINTPTQYLSDNVRFLEESFNDLRLVLEKTNEMIALCRSEDLIPGFLSEIDATIANVDVQYLTDEVPKAFKQALGGVERITKIVQSMKDFAYPGVTTRQPADLNRAIESTITVASNEWKYIADVETDYDPELELVPCLISEFNQVILNMIVNAAHSIADVVTDGDNAKGKITVCTKQIGPWAEIRVSDTGKGIPANVIKKIFDPFFTTKEVGKGTGQGLAISHTIIVDKHRGTIDVESEIGVGTTFIIRIPVAENINTSSVEVESLESVAV